MGRGQLVEGHFFAYLLPLFDEMKLRLVLRVAYSQNIFYLGSNLPEKVPNHYSEHLILNFINFESPSYIVF